MILTNRFLMEEEEEPRGDKKEDNAPSFLNRKMERNTHSNSKATVMGMYKVSAVCKVDCINTLTAWSCEGSS